MDEISRQFLDNSSQLVNGRFVGVDLEEWSMGACLRRGVEGVMVTYSRSCTAGIGSLFCFSASSMSACTNGAMVDA